MQNVMWNTALWRRHYVLSIPFVLSWFRISQLDWGLYELSEDIESIRFLLRLHLGNHYEHRNISK